DGKADIAVANTGANSIITLKNTGSSGSISFATPIVYTAGAGPIGVSMSDLDGDGKPDFVSANGNTTTVSVFKNNGTVSLPFFANKQDYDAGAGPYYVATGDLDGDGKPEIAIANYNPGTISVLRNRTNEPIISSFTPTAGYTATNVSIKGRNFTGTNSVRFGGIPASSFTVLSDTLIRAIVDTGATGVVKVTNAYGWDTLGVFTYTSAIVPAPAINSFTPATGSTATVVTIKGHYFTGASAVSFGGTPATSFTVNTDSTITATVGTGASGAVVVRTTFGVDTLYGFTYFTRPYTRVTAFTPTSGSTGTSVTIRGISFTGATSVRFGGRAAASFTIISDTAISAVVGTGASGSVSVSGPFGADSLAGFTYTLPLPAPKIYSFSPTSAATGTTVSINGTHFTNTTNVGFGGITATSFVVVNDSLIRTVVGSGRSGNVSVLTLSGTDTLTGFTYIPPVSSAPKVLSFTPASAASGTPVSIYGTHFTGATAVRFGGRNATSFTVITDSSITAFVGTGSTGSVSVTTPNGSDSLAGFTYIPPVSPAPKVLSFTPTSGSPGTQVHIYGSHFTNTTSVRFGGRNAALITVNNDSTITAVVGTGASGSVSVTTPNGSDSLGGFTYIPPPVNAPPKVLAFSPNSGSAGTTVVVYGQHFTGATAVSFGGVRTDSFTVVSDSIIMAIVSTGASGYTAVFTQYGADSLGGFIYNSAGQQAIAVYPNPAQGYTILKHPMSSNSSQVQVLDMQGTILKSITLPPNAAAATRIVLTGLTRGIYKITWTDGKNSMHQTIFVP
ncbi:MAG TPA: IPT/TIG domain-containing protein, partial [Chitinophagaceae bacterium]|nr:IPT/TIG domain-containing protein [Chitinophagaceae bacterium]